MSLGQQRTALKTSLLPKVRWCIHDATQRYVRPSRFRIPCSVRIPCASASVLRSPFSVGKLGAGVGDENLEGVHAVTKTTDFLRLLSYISGLVRSASACVTPRAMTMTRPRSIGPYRRAHTSINGYNCACVRASLGKGWEQDCHT